MAPYWMFYVFWFIEYSHQPTAVSEIIAILEKIKVI